LRARSHLTSHYTRGSVTTLDDFGGMLGQPLDTFFSLVENMVKKNRNRFAIVVLLTTLICNH
jgi:hypothetical protein